MLSEIDQTNKIQAKLNESHYKNCINFQEIDLSMGCKVGCIYCGLATNDGDKVTLNIDDILNCSAPFQGIYLSPNSDPFYPTVADKTHRLLEHFLSQGIPVLLITKSIIPDKTIQLISKYPDLVIPQISLARLDQELNNYIEPNAASVKDRLLTMRKLSDVGLKITALMMPVYHTIDDAEDIITKLIQEFSRNGVSIVRASYVLIRKGDKAKDKAILDRMVQHEKLRKSLELMTERIKPHIGESITISFEKRIWFYKTISKACDEYGIKFSACSVLDPEIFTHKGKDFVKCRNVWNYRKSKKAVHELETFI